MDPGWERQLARLGHWRTNAWEAMALSSFLSAQACLWLRRPISSTYPDTKTCKTILYPVAQQGHYWVVQYALRNLIFKTNTDKRWVWIVKSEYNSWSKSSTVTGIQTLGFGICHCKRQELAVKFGWGTWLWISKSYRDCPSKQCYCMYCWIQIESFFRERESNRQLVTHCLFWIGIKLFKL